MENLKEKVLLFCATKIRNNLNLRKWKIEKKISLKFVKLFVSFIVHYGEFCIISPCIYEKAFPHTSVLNIFFVYIGKWCGCCVLLFVISHELIC